MSPRTRILQDGNTCSFTPVTMLPAGSRKEEKIIHETASRISIGKSSSPKCKLRVATAKYTSIVSRLAERKFTKALHSMKKL